MRKCQMEGCQCQVAEGKQFCSDECRNNQHSADGQCDCNHPDCRRHNA